MCSSAKFVGLDLMGIEQAFDGDLWGNSFDPLLGCA